MKKNILCITFILICAANLYSQTKRDFTTHQTGDRRDYFSRNTSYGKVGSNDVQVVDERVGVSINLAESYITITFIDRKDDNHIGVRFDEKKKDGNLTAFHIKENKYGISSIFFSDDGNGDMSASILYPNNDVIVLGPLSNGYY